MACLSIAIGIKFFLIPIPLSETDIRFLPPLSIVISIWVASASIEFSINSSNAEDGLSTTSPAAI